jgi:ABC-type Fe3+-siderophore transport system permease subunit
MSDFVVKTIFCAAFGAGIIAGILLAICGALLSAYLRNDKP